MTRAADSLGVTQPALSAMVKKLEREVGAALLHRTGKGVETTDAGRVFLAHAEEALRAAEAAVQGVREVVGLERGSIRVGGGATATTYLLPPVVSAVRRSHPGLRFYIREAGSASVASAVASGELDLGIVTLPVTGSGAESLVRVPLVTDELRLIVPPGHTLEDRRRRKDGESRRREEPGVFRWKDLEGESLVAFEAGTAVRGMIDRAAAKAGVTLDVVMELRSIESIKHMVAAGIGVGFVSRFAIEDDEGLVSREGKLTRQLAIVRQRERRPSSAVVEFEEALLRSVAQPNRRRP